MQRLPIALVAIFTVLLSFSSAYATPPAQIPQTGQVSCYDTIGTDIPCSGTGQDGELRQGVAWPTPRFTDNGDQSMTDNLTGLIWTKNANLMVTRDPTFDRDGYFEYEMNDGMVEWLTALEYIKKLNNENYQGHNDWRLPNPSEMVSLINIGQQNQGDWLTAQGFINTSYLGWWTSSTYVNDTVMAWYLSLGTGEVDYEFKTYQKYVWPVRTATPINGGCGTSNATTVATIPTTNLCVDNSLPSVSGTGPWNWSCAGQYGGTLASCSANIQTYAIAFQSDANGTLSGVANQTVNYNASANAVTAVPASGYHFVNWTGTGEFVTTTTNPLILNNITAAQTIIANFAHDAIDGACGSANAITVTTIPTTNLCIDNSLPTVTGTGPWNWSCAGQYGGIPAGCSANIQTYAVTFQSDANGTLSGVGNQTVNYNASATAVTAVPATGYHFVNWTGTNGFVAITTNPLAVSNVTASQIITANFAPDPVYGVCGSANSTAVTATPTTGLCSTGTPSTVSGTGPWTWICSGSNGGTDAQCSAQKTDACITLYDPVCGTDGKTYGNSCEAGLAGIPVAYQGECKTAVNGVCGSANGTTVATIPTTNLCGDDSLPSVTGSGPWNWNCSGQNGGSTAPCSASKAKPGDCDYSDSVTIAEVASSIKMFLGYMNVMECVDLDTSSSVSVPEVQKVINGFLNIPIGSTDSQGPAARIALGSVTASADSQVVIPLTLTTNGASVASLSVDIGYDTSKLMIPLNSTGTAPLAATSGPAILITDENGDPIKNISQYLPAPGVLRLGILSTGNNVAIGDGIVAYVKFNVADSVKGELVLINSAGAAAPDATTVPVDAVNGVISALIHGVCGSANGTSVTVVPTTKLCADNSLPIVTGTGPWNWTCSGSNGGTEATCSANKIKSGDSDNNGSVSIAEVQSAINMFLGMKTVDAAVDTDASNSVSIVEVQQAINAFLGLDITTAPKAAAKLVQLTTNSELEAKLKAELVKRYDHQNDVYLYGWRNFLGGPVLMDGTRDLATPAAMTTSGAEKTATPAYSETNVQENGVDEGDYVKTDGNYLYLARGSRFIIIKTQPPEEAAIVSDIDLKEEIGELYLNGNQVTLITAPIYYYYGMAAVSGLVMPGHPVTRLYLYDIANRTGPVLKNRFDFPGTLQGSRRIGDLVYLVTNYGIDLPDPVTPWNYLPNGVYDEKAFSAASATAREENLKRIAALTLGELLPAYSRMGYSAGVAGTPVIAPAVNGSDVYAPITGNGADLSLVIAINTAAETPTVSSSGVLSSWCRMYMATDSLYLASGNDWLWIEPQAATAKQPVNPEPRTSLHKFSLAASSPKPLYRGSGVVNGWLNDRFSMGDYNGYLRIGTTRGGWWGEGISNRLAVLTENNGELIETGSIENIAPGERIYSMRLDRNRGYMVTFRQTDPLYTFDLTDPFKPRTAGEIKVNGFATYIHPMGENNTRLLTIGRSADNTGRVTGNKLQLFDVANLDAPRLIADQELGEGWSTALYDPHAFLYYEPLSLLAIPYFSYGQTTDSFWNYNSGLSLFTVNNTGIAPRGSVAAKPLASGYGSYNDTVDRSVVIGTDIYAIAHRSVTIADTATLKVKKSVDLPEGYGYYPLAVGGDVTTTVK